MDATDTYVIYDRDMNYISSVHPFEGLAEIRFKKEGLDKKRYIISTLEDCIQWIVDENVTVTFGKYYQTN